MQGIVTAHDALQFGELVHHVCQQVALAEFGGTHCRLRVSIQRFGKVFRQHGDTSLLVTECAELLLVGHPVQLHRAARQRLLAVLFPEEYGVFQARPYDAFVAGLHLGRVLAGDVRDGNEVRHQAAVDGTHRKELLVVLHAGDQRFGRDFQEACIEAAGDSHRPFHQRGDFIKQVFIDNGPATAGPAGIRHLCSNRLAPPVHVCQHHAIVLQRICVAGR